MSERTERNRIKKRGFNVGRYVIRQWPRYLVALGSMVLGVYFAAQVPETVAVIVDKCIVNGDRAAFAALGLRLFVFFCLAGVFNYFMEYGSDCISGALQRSFRLDVYNSIMAQDQSYFVKNNPGELMSRTKQDCETVGFAFGFILCFTIQIVFHTAYMLKGLLSHGFAGAIGVIVTLPIIAALAIGAWPGADKKYGALSDTNAEMNQSATESLGGIRTVKAFGREDFEAKRFDVKNSKYKQLSIRIDLHWCHWDTPNSMLARLMLVISVLTGGVQVIKGSMSLGDLVAVTEYVAELSWPMMELGWILSELTQSHACSKKLKAIVDREPLIRDGEKSLKDQKGSLEFRNVSYRAGETQILSNVSFTLKPGKSLGIMGATGSGKSTIANLTMRFFDPTEGQVLSDGVDLRELDIKSARNGKAIVTQDVFLFSDTISSNLEKGQKGKLPLDAQKEACTAAAADGFVSKLSEGYATVIGEKGVGLSGGQKQRVAIARAFASRRPLLILDDATSALDMETEKEVQRSIKHRNCTLMVIAHRISAVRDCDEIIILENGSIAERGTHEQLMALKGRYYETYTMQYPEDN